ncbi:MAG TPA: trigger factor [Actinomycetota bacterium]|nr:trigger factor [Actinomycetota bacterium]
MKSTVDNLSETRVKLTVEIPFEDLTDSINEAYKNIASQVNVPGFRRGKVPARIIDQRFGRGVVLEEVVQKAVPAAYDEAVREKDLRPLGQPEVEVTEIEDGQHIRFTAEVDVTPQFELPDYSGLEVEVSDSVVSDDDVEEQVEQLRTRFATVTPVERPAQTGDLVLVDVKGEIEKAVADLKAARETDNIADIQAKHQAVMSAAMKLGEAIYASQQEAAAHADAAADAAADGDDVVDADFEEVDGDAKSA